MFPFKNELNDADVKNRVAEVRSFLDVDSDGAVDHGAGTEGDLKVGNKNDAAAQGGSVENGGAASYRSPDQNDHRILRRSSRVRRLRVRFAEVDHNGLARA